MPICFQVPSKLFDPADRCIYCGDEKSERSLEHVIPLSLGGRLRIPKASCEACRLKIHPYETFCTEKMLVKFRRRLKFPSRNKKRWPPNFSVKKYDLDGTDGVDLPIAKFPRILTLPVFQRPRLIVLPTHTEDYLWTTSHRGDMQETFERVGFGSIEVAPYDIEFFARLLAKIAHGFFVAVLNAEYPGFEPILVDLILNGNDDWRDFVGGAQEWPAREKGSLYQLGNGVYTMHDDSKYLAVNIRLFGHWRAPAYEVLVAKRELNAAGIVE
jgi:hypothetical protein